MAKLPPPPSSGSSSSPSGDSSPKKVAPSPRKGLPAPPQPTPQPRATPQPSAPSAAKSEESEVRAKPVVAQGTPRAVRPGLARLPSPAPASSAKRSEPRPPLSRRAKIILGSIPGFLVAIVLCVLLVQYWQSKPTHSAMLDYLNVVVAPESFKFTSLESSVVSKGEGQARLQVVAVGKVSETLYTSSPAVAYAAEKLNLDRSLVERAEKALSAKDGKRLMAFANLSEPPADLRALVVLTPSATEGTPVRYQALLSAVKTESGWRFTMSRNGFEGDAPEGATKRSFGSNAFALDDEQSVAALKSKLDAYTAYARTVERAAGEFATKLAEERAAARQRMFGWLREGMLFAGTATARNSDDQYPVYLEVAKFDERSGAITFALRNDGGGRESRAFQGECSYDAETDRVALTLSSESNQATQDTGPLLSFYRSYKLQLSLDSTGKLAGEGSGIAFNMTAVADSELARVREEMVQGHSRISELTRPGTTYLGVVTHRRSGNSEEVILRIDRQEPRTSAFSGTLSSVQGGHVRNFTGLAFGNKYRAEGKPLRVEFAPGKGRGELFTASNNRSSAQFTITGDEIQAQSGNWDLVLKRATGGELSEIRRQQQSAAESFYRVIRAGAVLDGTGRDRSNNVAGLRMRIQAVDEELRTITLSIDSRDQAGITHQFSGSVSPEEGVVLVSSTGEGRFNPSGARKVPFFSSDSIFELSLKVDGSRVVGELDRYDNWSFEFRSVGGPSSSTSNSPTPPPRSATTPSPAKAKVEENPPSFQGYPTFPKASGVYFLRDSSWVALAANTGKISGTLAGSLGAVNEFLGSLSGTTTPSRVGDRVAVVSFSDRPPSPADGRQVVILLVGEPLSPSPAEMAVNRELRDYPKIEMAPLERKSDGRREADLFLIAGKFRGFGNSRLSGVVERVNPRLFIYTASEVLAPGNYAILAGGQPFEFAVGR